jgi:phospholipid/cholesterol/gamma-HCH transport system substrate-binding protein
VLNFFDPASCTKGYKGTKQRPANDLTEAPVNMGAYCAEPPGSPTEVRGAQNAPYAGKPAAVPQPQQAAPSSPPQSQLPGMLSLVTGGVGSPSVGRLLGLPS